jgi:endonuclease-3
MTQQLDHQDDPPPLLRFEAAVSRKGELLDHVNAYTPFVAGLSAQATGQGRQQSDARSVRVIAYTPQKMLALGIDGVTEHIKTIGLFRQKAKNVNKLSQVLVDDYGERFQFPRAAFGVFCQVLVANKRLMWC